MRYINIILCALMLLFIGVQYNDPDGPMWMAIYLVPAIWAAIAAFWPASLTQKLPTALLILCITGAGFGILYYWPDTAGWWKQDIWMEVETAREGMGMMIVLIVLIVAWISGRMAVTRLNDTTAGTQ